MERLKQARPCSPVGSSPEEFHENVRTNMLILGTQRWALQRVSARHKLTATCPNTPLSSYSIEIRNEGLHKCSTPAVEMPNQPARAVWRCPATSKHGRAQVARAKPGPDAALPSLLENPQAIERKGKLQAMSLSTNEEGYLELVWSDYMAVSEASGIGVPYHPATGLGVVYPAAVANALAAVP